ncbi:MAG: glycosyltransferase family 4 protein [Kiritimatiellaeota bacterium]|nr:glycosyltransferase family 4 protein [Kiritimatiellota bacterium]
MAHIVQILPALDEGGVERGIVEISRELVRRGHRSTVISLGGRFAGTLALQGGGHLQMDVKSKNPLTVPSRVSRLAAILKDIKPDIVHYRSRVPGWLFKFANRNLRLPFVSTVHGFNSVSAYSRIMTEGMRVICPSTAVITYIRKHYGTPEEKIRLIHRGIDPEQFNPATLDAAFIRDFRRQYIPGNHFVVLGVGRITPVKGFDALIRATALARNDVPNIRTLIVGHAEANRMSHLETLKRLIAELGLEDTVLFTGGQKKIAEIYSCGNVLVSCNAAKPEAFGRSMAEALAMNCPVIATAQGGALDIVRDGKNGWLLPPHDSGALAHGLVQASCTPPPRNLREDALTRFSLQQMVDQTEAVYREVLSE